MALNFQGLLDNVKKAADWYVKNTPIYQTANAVNNQVQSAGGWNAGLNRAINDVKTNPSKYFIGTGLSPYIAPNVERGLAPFIGQETAGNIGQFTQGAANATGILNPNLYGGGTQRTADLYRPISQQQQLSRDAGTFVAGSVITAPLSGGSTLMRLANIGKNALIGGAFGAGSTAFGAATQGRLPTQGELMQGAYEGAKNSWVYPATNRLTDIGLRQLAARVPAVASKVLPFTDEALNASKVATKNLAANGLREFLPAAGRQIAKASIREGLETPLETAYFAGADPRGGDSYLERYKNRFLPDLASNLVIGAGRSTIGLTPSGIKAGYTDVKTAADASGQGVPAYLMSQKAPGFIDPKATIGDMQDSVERPLLNKFVEAQRAGDLAGMEAVVKAEEADPAYADYASMHRGYLNRLLQLNGILPKVSPDEQLLADLNKAQQSGDYETSQKITDQIRKETATTPQTNNQLLLGPSKPSVTITKISELQKLSKSGADLSDVTFVAKTTNDARAALKLGLSGNQISPVAKSSRSNTIAYTSPEGDTVVSKKELTPTELQIEQNKQQFGNETKKPAGPVKSTIERWTRPIMNKIRSTGAPGEEISRVYDETEALARRVAGEYSTRLDDAGRQLSKEQRANFADYVEGKREIDSPEVQNAVNVWKELSDEIYSKVKSAGLDTGFIDQYFPHMGEYKDRQSIVDDLVKNGVDRVQAEKRVSGFLARSGERKYGSLDYSRDFPELEYKKNFEQLYKYIRGATTRSIQAENYGAKDELLYGLADQTKDPATVKNYLDQLLGKEEYSGKQRGEEASRMIRGVQTILKLNPITSLLNLTQNLNTIARTDHTTFAKALVKVMSNPDAAYRKAQQVGEIQPDMVKIYGEDYDNSTTTGKWIKWIGMNGTERFNRVMAVASGEIYAEKLMKQAANGSGAAERELVRLGIPDWKAMSAEDAGKKIVDIASQKVSQQSQFSAPESELPSGWQTPTGKVLTQFKSFAYQQTKAIGRETKRAVLEAKLGNFKPLVNDLVALGITAPLMGEVLADIKSIFKNKKRDDMTLAERYVDNIKEGMSFGLFDSLGGFLGEYGLKGVVSSFGGPMAGDAISAGQAAVDAYSGLNDYDAEKSFLDNIDPNNTTRRFALKSIPGVGQTASNTFVDNAYIDNVWGRNIGAVNEGLTKPNKEIYNSLKSTNPAYAETFKTENKYKPDEGKTSFTDVLSGKTAVTTASTMPPADAPEAVQKKYKSGLTKRIELGEQLTPEETAYYYLDNKTLADQKTYKDVNDFYSKVIKLQNDKDLSDAAKQNIMYKSGISKPDWEYYQKASGTDEEKLSEALRIATTTEDADAMIAQLIAGKRTIGNKAIFTATQMDYLYDRGLITKQQKALIAAVKYDELLKQFYVDRDYKGSVGGSSGSGGSGSSSGTMSNAKLVSLMKQVYSIFGDEIKQEKSVVKGTSIPKVKSVTSKPLSSILKVRTKASGNKLWFKAY